MLLLSPMSERHHPPLRRVIRGAPAKVDPTLEGHKETNHELVERKESSGTRSHLTAHSSRSLGESSLGGVSYEQDSCYSSCSEESHPSLSRESSDALSNNLSQLNIGSGQGSTPRDALTPLAALPSDLVEFANNLGYSERQLQDALLTVGLDAGQDRVLAELIRRGGGNSQKPSEVSLSDCGSHPKVSYKSSTPSTAQLRSIVIDGSNIAMTHGRREVFSCIGIKQCVQFFLNRGHPDLLVFIPQFRREAARADCPIVDQHILTELDAERRIVWTPSRRVNGRRIVCHDDRYILKTAEEKDSVIVSNDEYRDLVKENPRFKELVEKRLLMYSFVDGRFMPPDDPLGRHGPSLDQFLSTKTTTESTQICPYAKRKQCTYGKKCRYFHPERAQGLHVSVTERLIRERNNRERRPSLSSRGSVVYDENIPCTHQSIGRTQSLNVRIEQKLGVQESSPLTATNHAMPMLSALPVWHNTLSRNQSAPLAGIPQPPAMSSETSRSNSLIDVDMGLGSAPLISQSHMYSPSPAVWGNSEYSVGPLSNQGPWKQSCVSSRSRLQYHLSQIFPSSAVEAVMAAHPNENDPQKLCQRIMAFQHSFNN